MKSAISGLLAFLSLTLIASACSATPSFELVADPVPTTESPVLTEGLNSVEASGAVGATTATCDIEQSSVFGMSDVNNAGTVRFIATGETVDQLTPGARGEPVPSSWLWDPFACVEALVDDGSEVSCGWHMSAGVLTEVRLQPHVLRFTVYPQGADGSSFTIGPVHAFNQCPESTKSPTDATTAAAAVEVRQTVWDADLAARVQGEIAAWTAAVAHDDLDETECTGLTVTSERIDDYHLALTDFLEIDAFWQPVADDWTPNPERFAELASAGDRFRGSALPISLEMMNEPTGEMLSGPGLSAVFWIGFPEPGEFEAEGVVFLADAYRAEVGRRAAIRPQGTHQSDMIDVLIDEACDTKERAAAASAAAAIADPDVGPLCSDLARVYAARVTMRAEVAKDPTERHPDLRSLIEPLNQLHQTIHEHWDVGGNPYFNNGAAWAFYVAESALVWQVENGDPMNVAEVTFNEEAAAPLHTFAKEYCPEITEGIDLASVLDLVSAPDSGAVTEAQAGFCQSARSMLQARLDLLDLIDPRGAATPWTPEAATHYQTVLDEVDFLTEQVEQNELLINPDGLHIYTGMFTSIATGTTQIRTSHFGPVIVPMKRYVESALDDPPGSNLDFLALCNASADEVASFDITAIALPGPMYEGDGYDADAAAMCTYRDNALIARSGYRQALERVLAGEDGAETTANAYHQRFEELGGDFGLGAAIFTVLGDADGLTSQSVGFEYSETILHEALVDDLGKWELDRFAGALVERDQLLAVLAANCGQPSPAPLIDPLADAQLLEQLIAIHELPAVLTVERLCTELEVVYSARVDFRALIAVDNAYRAEQHLDTIAEVYDDLWSVDEMPVEFERSWVDAMRRNEGQLFVRLDWGEPIEVGLVKERLPQVALLEDYISTNCPNVTEGLDVTPVLEVFGTADDGAIATARVDFCSAVNELFDARLAFRAMVPSQPQPITDEVEAAFDRILVATESAQAIYTAQALLINHEGLDFASYRMDSIEMEESVIRHAFFGPTVLPRIDFTSTNDPAGTRLATFAAQVCEDPSAAVTTPVPTANELGGPTIPAPSTVDGDAIGDLYCPYLETLRTSQVAMIDAFDRAADGDPVAGRAALQLEQRQSSYYFAMEDTITARFPEAVEADGNDNLTFRPFAYGFILKEALLGRADQFDRSSLERFVAGGHELEPAALRACPDLPTELHDISLSEILGLFDRLQDL